MHAETLKKLAAFDTPTICNVIELFDVTGKRVHARVVPSLASSLVLELPATLREGLYLVKVRIEGQEPRSARVVLSR